MLFMIKALSLDGPVSRARTLYSFARARHWSAFNMEHSAGTTIENLTVVAALGGLERTYRALRTDEYNHLRDFSHAKPTRTQLNSSINVDARVAG